MHNGYININNEKMSKSLGNGINVKEILKTIKPNVLRFFMLSTHYRHPLNFTDEAIEQARSAVQRIENCLLNLQHRLAAVSPLEIQAEDEKERQELARSIREIMQHFDDKMSDDFNTPDALSAVFELVSEANNQLKKDVLSAKLIEMLLAAFDELNQVLGILPVEEQSEELVDEEIEKLIAERNEARKAKQWQRADEIRDLLADRGIILEDTPQGVRWKRK